MSNSNSRQVEMHDIGRIGNHRPILSSLLITLTLHSMTKIIFVDYD